MASPFWSDYRQNPRFLWPISAIAALSIHGLVGWWLLQVYTASPASEPAVIKVVALPSAQAIPDAAPTSVTPTNQPIGAAPSQTPATATLTPPSPTPVRSPAPASATPQSLPDTPPAPLETSAETVDLPPQPSGSAPVAPTVPPSTPAGPGLQLLWSVTSPAQLQLADQLTGFLSVQDACVFNQDWSQGSVTVGLRTTVETNGRLSQAIEPLGSGEDSTYSDDSAYQEALICVSKQRFLPALETALANQTPNTREVELEVTAIPRL